MFTEEILNGKLLSSYPMHSFKLPRNFPISFYGSLENLIISWMVNFFFTDARFSFLMDLCLMVNSGG